MVVLVSLMACSAPVSEVWLPWSAVSESSRMARRGLLAEHVDGEDDGVEDGGLLVAVIEGVEGVGDEFEIGREAVQQGGRAVEADYGDLVLDVADQVVEQGAEVAVLFEVRGAGTAGFDDDDESQRLVAGVLLEMQWLLDAVVGEDEVVGFEGVDELAGLGADERGDDDEAGANGDGGRGRRCLGVGLSIGQTGWARRRGGGRLRKTDGCSKQRDGGEMFHSRWAGSEAADSV